MINILEYLPPGAHLSISLEDYETFIRIAKQSERERFTRLIGREIEKLQGTPNDQLVMEMTSVLLNLMQRVKGEQA